MRARSAAARDERRQTINEDGVADEALLAMVLDDANQFVRHLRLPAEQHHLYDDIVQDTMLIAHDRFDVLAVLEPGARRGWTRSTMFFVARNTRRAELRRTTTWERLRDAFEDGAVRRQFDEPDHTLTERFGVAFSQLSDSERTLLIESVWVGLTPAELAERHGLTPNAIHHRVTRARKKFRESFANMGQSGSRADIT